MELNFAIFPFPKKSYDVSIFGNQYTLIPAYDNKQSQGK